MKTLNRVALFAAGAALAGMAATASAQMVNTPGPSGQTPSADITISHAADRARGSENGSTASRAAWSTVAQASAQANKAAK
jgi:hypothetical protein